MAAARYRPPGPRAAAHGPGYHRDHRHHAGRHRHRAATAIIDALGVPVIGLNCATGPKEMAERVRHLAAWRSLISCPMPACPSCAAATPTIPSHRTSWPAGSSASLPRMASISSAAAAAPRPSTSPRSTPCCEDCGGRLRPRARPRQPQHALAGLPVLGRALRQENAFLAIGERCNANGSKKFRELQAAGDWDGCVAMGRAGARGQQRARRLHGLRRPRRGSRDDRRRRAPARPGRQPAGDRSTELPVLEAALALYGGKAVLNSINFEDGGRRPPPG